MSSFVLLFLSLIIGVALQRVKAIPNNAHTTLGTLILYVPLPAISLLSIPHLEWRLDLISLILVGWIVFGVAYVFYNFLGSRFSWDKALIGALILNTGLGNTSFIGYPVIEALYGKEAVKNAILLDQSGSFLLVSSLGIWVALKYSTGHLPKAQLFKKILLFPPFISFIVAILLGLMGWRAEGEIKIVLERLALTLTPLALICVGFQLKWGEIKADFKYLCLGLGYKLFLAPLIIFAIYYACGVNPEIFRVAVMESAMAPMITASILASTHDLRPRLSGMMVGVGVPLSFLTLGLWYFVLALVN